MNCTKTFLPRAVAPLVTNVFWRLARAIHNNMIPAMLAVVLASSASVSTSPARTAILAVSVGLGNEVFRQAYEAAEQSALAGQGFHPVQYLVHLIFSLSDAYSSECPLITTLL
jgi:hypothetical protein